MLKLALPLVAFLAVGGSAAGGAVYLLNHGETVEEVPPPSVVETSPEPSQAVITLETPTPTPAPAAKGGTAPDGCLASELAYVDPGSRFAFRYPADMELITVDTGDGLAPTVMHPLGENNRVVVNFGWSPQRRSITGEPCIDSPLLIVNRRIEDFFIAGRTVQACFQDHYERDDAGNPTALVYETIEMEVPVASGFVHVDAAFTGPDFVRQGLPVEETALRILGAAVIY